MIVLCFGALLLTMVPPTAFATPLDQELEQFEESAKAGNAEEATAHGETALSLLAPGDARREDVLITLAFLFYDAEDYPRSEHYFSRALSFLRSARPDDSVSIADLQKDLAEVVRLTGDYARARVLLEEALEMARKFAPGSGLHAITLNNLAGICRDEGDFAATARLLEEALEISKGLEGDQRVRLSNAHLNLAETYRFQARYEDAEPHYRDALAIARDVFSSGQSDLVYYLNQFAALYSERGAHDSALPLRDEAIEILAASDGSVDFLRAQLLQDEADDFCARGAFDDAIASYREALALRSGLFPPSHWEVAATRTKLARALAESDSARWTEALELVTTSIDDLTGPMSPESRAEAHALRGALYKRVSNFESAAADMERSIEIVEDLRPVRGGGDPSRAALLERYIEYYDDLVRLKVETGDTSGALRWAERARARVFLDRLATSRADLRADVDREVLRELEAREQDARARMAVQQETLRYLPWDTTMSQQEKAATLQQAERQLDSAVQDYRAAQEAIFEKSPRWQSALQDRDRIVTLEAAQREIVPRDGLLLLYEIGSTSSLLFVVGRSPGEVSVHELVVSPAEASILRIPDGALTTSTLSRVLVGRKDASRDRLADSSGLIDRLRGVGSVAKLSETEAKSMAEKAPSSFLLAEELHALYKVLVPAAAWLRIEKCRDVVVIPDGPLHTLAFEALVVTPGRNAASSEFWLDAGPPIRYAQSLTSLRHLVQRRGSARSSRDGTLDVLTVSDPVYAPTGRDSEPGVGMILSAVRDGSLVELPPLPGTRRESAAIAKAFGSQRVESVQGEKATEPNVRKAIPGKRYLHLATHGIVNEQQSDVLATLVLAPLFSSSGDTDSDGFLQLFEIFDIDISCELAVLSACETNFGRRVEGEGVFALSRGFLAAGARRVVSSLWSVSDESTAELVGDFFGRIALAESEEKSPDYVRALRDAKLSVRRQSRWASPHYWAPFVLSGVP